MFSVVSALLVAQSIAGDPSSGWLSYAEYRAPNEGIITAMNVTWEVPSEPSRHGGSPAFWFGTQTSNGNGALIQPILKWESSRYNIFHEIFDWTWSPFPHDEQGKRVRVQPGDSISSTLTYRPEDQSYDMFMASAQLGTSLTYNYKLKKRQKKTESVAYFVLEHQPSRCDEFPPNGQITFTDISVEVNGELVESPVWVPKQEVPKCSSKVEVPDPRTVKISWDATAGLSNVVV